MTDRTTLDPEHERGQAYVDTGVCRCSEPACVTRRAELSAQQRPTVEVVRDATFAYAECATCPGLGDIIGAPSANVRSVKALGYRHAHKHGHSVRVVTTQVTTYRG